MTPRADEQSVPQHILTIEVFSDDQGRLSAQVDSDLDEADAARVLGVIADQLNPDRDRADEVGAWGAGRRRRA